MPFGRFGKFYYPCDVKDKKIILEDGSKAQVNITFSFGNVCM